ncbi:MAG: hypothetical protein E6Q67_00860 [Roseateles sp.]|nr:MAG: hypothetical protein E6Q67_00860 [Roseateles sp.]
MPGPDTMNHALSVLEIAATFSAISSVLVMTCAAMKALGLLDRLCCWQALASTVLMGFALWTFAGPRNQVEMLMVVLGALLATLGLAVLGAVKDRGLGRGRAKPKS